jgi:hypothetical protein
LVRARYVAERPVPVTFMFGGIGRSTVRGCDMRRRAFLIAALTFLGGLLVGMTVTDLTRAPARAGRGEVIAVIDAEVPGTRVYHRGELLGEVPLALSRERLAGLGLAPAAGLGGDRLGIDLWGEALFFGREGEYELKVMLQVPEEFADRFLAVETPWGRRTQMGPCEGTPGPWEGTQGGNDTPNVRVHFRPAQSREGLRVRLAVPAQVGRAAGAAAVELTCKNVGPATVAGGRPFVWIGWGGPDTPWQRRSWRKDVPLPAEWERIAPGQMVRATIEVPSPNVAGDYEVFATFDYNEPAAGSAPPLGGWYSDTRLLRVR